MRNITAAAARVFAAFKVENKAACKTDTALIDSGIVYAEAMDTMSADTILAEIAALPEAIKITDTSVRKAMGLPTNVALVYGLAHVGDMVTATAAGTESLVGFDVRLAWKMAAAVANEEKLGGGVAALSATLNDADDVFDAFDALAKLDRAVKDARNAAKKAAKDAANGNVGASDGESDGESESSESESSPSSANRWASVLAVLTALAADASGMTEADMAAHAQATAILADMVPADTTPSSPAGIEIVFPDVFVPA